MTTKQERSAIFKSFQSNIKKNVSFDEGKTNLLTLRNKLTEICDYIFDVCNDDDFCKMPLKTDKTIAYYLYHLNRIEDATANILIAGKEQLFFAENFDKRLNSPIITTGNEIARDGLIEFSKALDIKQLREYVITVMANVGSQGIPTNYEGFAVISNPTTTGPTCTCVLKETNASYGVFIMFSFRISPLDRQRRRMARISECMSVRRSDGTSFVYRLLISENFIDDEEMKYFIGHLKLGTSENTCEGKELHISILEKYMTTAKKYFAGYVSDENNEFEVAIFRELREHFGERDKEYYTNIIHDIEKLTHYNVRTEKIKIIDPAVFDSQDKKHLLLWSWIGKYSLSARHDKVENVLDDEVDSIHQNLYPELYDTLKVLEY